MKQIFMKEFRLGWGTEQAQVTEPINRKIQELNTEGIADININVTPTGKGVVVTLIYEKAEP